MKRRRFFRFLFLLAILETQVILANADSRTYDWNVYGNTHYDVTVIVQNPQLDSSFDVTVRLTLTSKDPSLDYTYTRWMQVILESVDKSLQIQSEKKDQTVILNTPGDSWQNTFAFEISSSEHRIAKGESIEISVVYMISIDEIDIPRHLTWNHIGDNRKDPLKITLSIPLLRVQKYLLFSFSS